MSRIAPLWDGWARANRGVPGRLTGASSVVGQPFLPDVFGPASRLLVEVAWGADPNGDSDLWYWSDITTDVHQESVGFGLGRLNEAKESNPASGSLVVYNPHYAYSIGPISPNWPNVKINLPLRIQVDPEGYGFQVLFQGNVTDMKPDWDTTGKVPVITMALSGSLLQISNGKPASVSSPRRFMQSLPDAQKPVVYYPLDDGPLSFTGQALVGSGEATIRPYYPQDSPVKILGQGRLAPWLPEGVSLSNEGSSSGVSGQLTIPFPSTPKATSQWIVGLTISYVEGQPDQAGGFEGIEIAEGYYSTAVWSLNLNMLNRQLILRKPDNTTPLVTQTETITFDGDMHYIELWLTQVGADVYFQYILDGVGAATAIVTNTTLKHPTEARIYTTGRTRRYFGHAALWINGNHPNQHIAFPHNKYDLTPAMLGYNIHRLYGLLNFSETGPQRMVRLCTETSTDLQMIGQTPNTTTDDFFLKELNADSPFMGCQPTKDLVSLLRECEAADQGRLFDGVSAGLVYVARNAIENRAADLTIDVAGFQLFPPFDPRYDTRGRVNTATAGRSLGQTVTYTKTDGPLGTLSIGPFEDSIDVNVESDDRIKDFASWLVNLSSTEGYRYPQVSLSLAVTPQLVRTVMGIRPGSRIDLTGIGDVLLGHDDITVRLLVEGVSHGFGFGTEGRWTVTFQCSPFDPWRIGELAATTGDVNPNVLRLVPTASRLTTAAGLGATSLTVETTAGPRWTVNADDFPLYITVGGQKVRVTAITGTGTTQTFTIDPLPLARPALSPVDVWDPGVLRL